MPQIRSEFIRHLVSEELTLPFRRFLAIIAIAALGGVGGGVTWTATGELARDVEAVVGAANSVYTLASNTIYDARESVGTGIENLGQGIKPGQKTN